MSVEDLFDFDPEAEVSRISRVMVELLRTHLRRRGLVVAVSGGVDSSVACGLAVKAVGNSRVFGLVMPERDSSPESAARGEELCRQLQIQYRVEDLSPILEAIGCYRWRDDAIRRVFPAYGGGWRSKIAIAGGTDGQFNHFNLIVQNPAGQRQEARLGHREYLQIVAATNFKQRVRKNLEYFHADRLNYAVVGTPNRVEYDQGFFVKNGDGSADIKPLAHLYKVQVFRLARYLGLPPGVVDSVPTTDTYSLSQGQDEFYFALPYLDMDVALLFKNLGRTPSELARTLGITDAHARLIYEDIDLKRRTTGPLHWPGILMEKVPGPQLPPAPEEFDTGL